MKNIVRKDPPPQIAQGRLQLIVVLEGIAKKQKTRRVPKDGKRRA
jgi:hypothetical protein